jgi:FMN phosphatase YigB (HAD superfamily)
MKKLLLALDIGNVCVRIDHANFFRKLGIEKTPPAMQELLKEFEFGRIASEEDFFAGSAEIFNGRFTVSEIKEAFDAIIIAPVPGMEELVRSFPAMNVQAVFFSDISLAHLRRTVELFSAFSVVSGGVFSFECGNWKPSEEMFSAFESRYGVPDIYVDDREMLIEAAKKRPWNAEIFTGAKDLREKLQALS